MTCERGSFCASFTCHLPEPTLKEKHYISGSTAQGTNYSSQSFLLSWSQPSLLCHNIKINPRYAGFAHKTTKVYCWRAPWWAQEDRKRNGLQSARRVVCGELGPEKQGGNIKQSQQEEDEDKVSNVSSSKRHDIFKNDSDDAVSLVALLKACAKQKNLRKGSRIHSDIIKRGLLEKSVFIGSALVNMYAKCAAFDKAQEVLNKLPVRNEVSWNALIAGYAQHGRSEEAVACYVQMQSEGAVPSAVTFACILKACGSTGASDKGQDAHAKIIKAGLLDIEVMVGNALVDMYAKCGLLAKAQDLFDELLIWDVVSWNALIGGYAQHEHNEEALNCFDQMRLEGFSPKAVTFTCALKACGHIGVAYKGQEIHADIIRHGLSENDVVIGTGLVDMYANCGMLEEAQEVFDKMQVRNVVSWSALMVGYAQVGRGEDVFSLFDKMVAEGMVPDLVTLTTVLHTCSHRGLVDKAQKYFEIVSKGYCIIPTLEHHACMIDLFCRVGYLDKAVAMMKEMPYSPNLTTWHTLLGACEKWENVKLGRWAFEHAVQLDEKDTATYICMSNIYVAAGRQEDADKIEAMRVTAKA